MTNKAKCDKMKYIHLKGDVVKREYKNWNFRLRQPWQGNRERSKTEP